MLRLVTVATVVTVASCLTGQPSGMAGIAIGHAIFQQKEGTVFGMQAGGGCHQPGRLDGRLALRGGGNSLGVDGEAITEEQAGEELIKAATSGDVHGLDPAGIEYLVQAGAPVNYQVRSSRGEEGLGLPLGQHQVLLMGHLLRLGER